MSHTLRYDEETHKKPKDTRRKSTTFTWVELGFDESQVKAIKITYVKKRRKTHADSYRHKGR